MDHPWRRLRALADWLLRWECLPDELGRVDWAHRTITMDPRQGQAERRSTIAHELEHIRLGPPPDVPVLIARDEERVNRAAARRLIPIRALGDALAWSQCPHEVAAELWVDRATVEARLRGLHPSERAYLRRRLEHQHDHA